MQPTLYTGDLAILRKQDTYAVGDVVAFQVEGGVVIHRIVGGNAREGYVMKGDNRAEKDLWRPKPSNIGGRMVIHIPKVGLLIAVARNKQNLPIVVGLFAFVAVLVGGLKRRPAKRAAPVRFALRPPSRPSLAWSVAALCLAGLFWPVSGAAAPFPLDPGSLAVFKLRSPGVARIGADVNVVPEALEKRSKGDHVTVFIDLPAGFPAARIDASRLILCAGAGPCTAGVPAQKPQVVAAERTLKAIFDRGEVLELLDAVPTPSVVRLTVTGLVRRPAATFSSSDTVKLLGAPATLPSS